MSPNKGTNKKAPISGANINDVLKQADTLLQAEDIFSSLSEWQEMMTKYNCAIREIRTKFEVLNDELSIISNRNPIHGIYSRIKNPRSIMEKLHRKGLELTMDNVRSEINDIAGVRVICDFADDISHDRGNAGIFLRRKGKHEGGSTASHHCHGLLGQPRARA